MEKKKVCNKDAIFFTDLNPEHAPEVEQLCFDYPLIFNIENNCDRSEDKSMLMLDACDEIKRDIFLLLMKIPGDSSMKLMLIIF